MGRRRDKHHHLPKFHLPKFHTLPSSPTHSFSSSSSDFEFTISLSPRKSSAALCPADELFYKGKILPLHLSPRLSMVRTLLLASSSSSSDTTATASRDSTGSSTDSHSSFSSDLSQLHPESSRPSSVTEDALELDFKCIDNNVSSVDQNPMKKPSKFSLSKFSSVFRKEPKNVSSSSTVSQKRTSTSAKEVISRYLRKVKPLYEKISQKQQVKVPSSSSSTTETRMARSGNPSLCIKKDGSRSTKERNPISAAHQNKWDDNHIATVSHSFSGNTRHRRRRSCISSCPSSIGSSPNHSGILCRNGFTRRSTTTASTYSDNSSMEELQSAIQGAITHCKNSMLQNKTMVSNEGF